MGRAVGYGQERHPWLLGALESKRELRGERPAELARAGVAVLQAVLKLQLRVRRETEAGRDVDAPQFVAPGRLSRAIRKGVVELLVPPQSPEPPRRELVLRLDVIG